MGKTRRPTIYFILGNYANFFAHSVFFVARVSIETMTQLQEKIRNSSWSSIKELADEIGVAHTTLSRWIDNDRVPKEDNRAQLATALDISIEEIPSGPARRGTAGLTGVYAEFDEIPTNVWSNVADGTKPPKAIDILALTGLITFDTIPFFTDRLRNRVITDQVPVRVMLANPEGDYIATRAVEEHMETNDLIDRGRQGLQKWKQTLSGLGEKVELRTYDSPAYNSLYRFGDQAIAAFHLHGAVGTETIAANITEEAQWFQGLLKHFDDLWEKAQPVSLDE